MIASKGARGCFARAMHNGVNNGTDAAENSEARRPRPLTNEREVRKVSVTAFDLQSVPDVRALGACECGEIDGQVDGAGVRPVDERDELERGGILLAELRQEVRLDHAGGAPPPSAPDPTP